MKWKSSVLAGRWLMLPPILVGLAVAGWFISRRQSPQREPAREAERAVRVIRLEPVDVVPRAFGYGTAQPGQVWQAVAEVRGRVLEVHPQLRSGAMVHEGEVLLRIDPAEYELARAQLQAEIARLEAQQEELVLRQANDQASLEIENQALSVAEAELQRVETLAARNAASASEIDQQKRAVLVQRQSVQRLSNSLRLIPQQQKAVEAELAVKQAGLEQAELDLAKTSIAAPFACRLAEVEIQPGQFLAAGQMLFEAHGTAFSEVEAQIPLDQLRTLIEPKHDVQSPVMMDPRSVKTLFNFRVIVRYRSGDFLAEWEGHVVRLREQVDPRTRMMGLVVAVDKPYDQAIPGRRPPLVQGMYCEIELQGAVRREQIVIPHAALHDGHVYIIDDDRRLRRRAVVLAFAQAGFVCVQEGLAAAQTLVVSDPTPAIEGLLTEPVLDEELQQRLATQAGGEEPAS